MLSFINTSSSKKRLFLYHILIGLISSLAILDINFLLSLHSVAEKLTLGQMLVCVVYPCTLLFFCIGQLLKKYVSLRLAKAVSIVSLMILFLFFYYSYQFIQYESLQQLLVICSGSLFFLSMGRLTVQLRNELELKLTSYIYLGKFVGILIALLFINFIGYNQIILIALLLSFFTFYGLKRKSINFILILTFAALTYYQGSLEIFTFKKFNQTRIEREDNYAMSKHKPKKGKEIHTFWDLRGFATLQKEDNDSYWWIQNFIASYKSNYNGRQFYLRKKIYSQVSPQDKVLILSIGGGASLDFLPNVSKNIYGIDRDCIGLQEFSKINQDLTKINLNCGDGNKAMAYYPSVKFQYIYLETSISQGLKSEIPFISPFSLITLETLGSYKEMLDQKSGVFIFEVVQANLKLRKRAFNAAWSNLLNLYGKDNCKFTVDNYSEKTPSSYVFCSNDLNKIQNFMPDEVYLDHVKVNTRLNDDFPFLNINKFMLENFGQEYYLYFQAFFALAFFVLVYLVNKRKIQDLIFWSEFFSNIQFYAIVYFIGSFLYDDVYSYLFISALNMLIIFAVIQYKNVKIKFNKLLFLIYLVFLGLLFVICRDYSIQIHLKNTLTICLLIAILILNAFIFKSNIAQSFKNQRNVNLRLYVFYALSAIFALITTLTIGIFPTLLLTTICYLWINVFAFN